MNKLLARSWLAAPLGAVVYLGATLLFWQKPTSPARESLADVANVMNAMGPSWNFNNPEADLLITELKLEKKSLDQRQQQLDDLATRLNTERAEVGQVIQTVRKLQADFDKAVVRVKDDEKDNLKKLSKMYAAMTPDVAASVLEQFDNEAIVKILMFLKNDETAAIVEAIAKKSETEAARAAQISEKIRLSSHSPTPK